MKTIILSLVLTTSIAFAQTQTASVNGTWKVHSTVAGNESDSTCTFSQKETALTGTCSSEQGDSKLTGKIDGQQVSWTYISDYNGTALTVKYTGKLAGDKITGTETIEPFGVSGDFTATLSK